MVFDGHGHTETVNREGVASFRAEGAVVLMVMGMDRNISEVIGITSFVVLPSLANSVDATLEMLWLAYGHCKSRSGKEFGEKHR